MTQSDMRAAMMNNRKRKKIISAFYELKDKNPQGKKLVLIRQVAEKLEYVIDKNNSSSYVTRVLREWGA